MSKLGIFLLTATSSFLAFWPMAATLVAQEEQQSSLEELIAFSSETGFPIIAIASGDNCPACQKLKQTIQNDAEIKRTLEKFLILHLDVESKEYAQWIRQHPTAGKEIPQLFIVRSDSKELFNRIGSMEADELRKTILTGIASAGRPISEEDSATIARLAEELLSLQKNEKLIEAIELASKSTSTLRLAVNSYAASAVKLRNLLSEIQGDLNSLLQKQQDALERWSELSSEAKANQIANTVETIRRLEGVKVAANSLAKLKSSAQSIPEVRTALADNADLPR